MERGQAFPMESKGECNLYPGHSHCLKKIEKGDCPDKENHGCGSKQRKHATDSDLQKIQTAHFMRALAEGKHLENFSSDEQQRKTAQEISEKHPFRPFDPEDTV